MRVKTATRRPKPLADVRPVAPADPLGAALERALSDERDPQLRDLIARLLRGDDRELLRAPKT